MFRCGRLLAVMRPVIRPVMRSLPRSIHGATPITRSRLLLRPAHSMLRPPTFNLTIPRYFSDTTNKDDKPKETDDKGETAIEEEDEDEEELTEEPEFEGTEDQSVLDRTYDVVDDELKESKALALNKHVFVGPGQYYHSDKKVKLNRFIACVLGQDLREPYEPLVIFDGELPAEHGLNVLRNVISAAGALSVVHGEVDSLHTSSWKYGYFHDTTFTIFSDVGRICHVALIDGQPALELYSKTGEAELIPLSTIKHVCVSVSADPFITRRLFLQRHHHPDVTILVDELEDSNPELVKDKMAMLMTTTEWIVKAGAGLALVINRFGGSAPLRLSKVLLAQSNEWVKKRNEQWQEMLARFRQSSD